MALSKEQRAAAIAGLTGTERFHGSFEYPKECYAFAERADKEVVQMPAVDGYGYTINIFTAKNRTAHCPVHINIHGGGWFFPHHINDELFSAWVADQIAGVVVDIDYTLSGEAPWPVAFDQCYEVGKYVYAHCAAWDCDEKRISMGGYSAGGSLTVGLALRAAEEKDFPLCLIINGYGPTDMGNVGGGASAETQKFINNTRGAMMNDLYLDGNDELLTNPYVSPAKAPDEMLAKLPRTVICSAGECPFRFDNEAFGYHLASVGVEVTMRRYLGACHGFIPHFMDRWQDGAELIVRSIRDASL